MSAKISLESFDPSQKIPLPVFLKLIMSSGLTMDKAMAVASKVYKTHNTPAALDNLTDGTLVALHVDDKEQRRLLLAAVKPSGRRSSLQDPVTAAAALSAALSRPESKKKTSPKKRKRDDDLNESLPDAPPDETASYGNLEFGELQDEEALMTKSVVINRAPVMTAWAMIVAERMGFKREEALSLASAYTEMNATSKGVKLGIFEEGRGKGIEPTDGDGQPYVEFVGRKYVHSHLKKRSMINPLAELFTTRSSQWRALLKGEPVPPSAAYSYITKSFRQTTPYILGSMRLLAGTFTPEELNRIGFDLYADFRPHVEGWGKKGEIRCEAILALRKTGATRDKAGRTSEAIAGQPIIHKPEVKKQRTEMTVEEYEAALDAEGYDELFAESGT